MAQTKTTKIYHLTADGAFETAQTASDLAQPSYVSQFLHLPFGRALLVYDLSRSDGPYLCGLGFPEDKPEEREGFLNRFPGLTGAEHQPPPVAQAVQVVADALSQGVVPPLKLTGTVFQHRVWQALLGIPFGASDTYGGLAWRLGSSPRAVGGAVGANPLAWLVPCHRVLGAGGALHGYRWGSGVKAKLLASEGVSFLQ
ncbi:MAG: methylated-DNA--[protein]-cysteine S-methyltransferase [Parvibaculales bacterium]